VACLCLAGSAVAWSLADPRPRRRPWTLMPWTLLPWAARAAGAVMLVRSAGVEVLTLAGGPGLSASVSPEQRFWTLVLWNPWFALGGLLFLGASVGEIYAGPHRQPQAGRLPGEAFSRPGRDPGRR
jgi:hypothetical protein